MFGESADMKLIDYKIFHRKDRLLAVAPVEIIFYYTRVIRFCAVGIGAPDALLCDSTGVGIKKYLIFIKYLAVLGVVWTVKLIGIFEIIDIKTEDDHGKYISDTVMIRKSQSGERFISHTFIQEQIACRCLI